MTNEPPTDGLAEESLTVSAPKQWAAGIPGVRHSLEYSYAQMGARRALLTLRRVNQKDGFDCPGCAWPDPAGTAPAEFCENGAKAVAEEATTRRVTRTFFARAPRQRARQKSRLLARSAGPAHRAGAQARGRATTTSRSAGTRPSA